jgi:CHAT domain-containing protein
MAHRARLLSLVLAAASLVEAPAFSGEPPPLVVAAGEIDEGSLEAEASRLQDAGKYREARGQAEKLVALREKKHGPADARTAAALRSLGSIELSLGDVVAAGEHAGRAVAMMEAAAGHEAELAAALATLAEVWAARGRRDDAERAYERAIAVDEKAGAAREIELGVWLGKLAAFHVTVVRDGREGTSEAQARVRKAKKILERALEIHERRGAERALAFDLGVSCEINRADEPRARACFERALPLAERVLGPAHPELARLLASAARFETSSRQLARADELFRRAEGILQRSLGAAHPELAELYSDWAMSRLHEGARDTARAFALRKQAEEIEERHLEAVLAGGAEIEKLTYARTFERRIDRAISLELLAPGEKEATRIALGTILRRKGRVLDVMAGSVSAVRAASDAEAQELVRALVAARQALATAIVAGPRERPLAAYEEDLAELHRRADDIESRVSLYAAAHVREKPKEVTLEAVQSALPDDAALIEIYRYTTEHPFHGSLYHERTESRYMIYLLRRTGEPLHFFMPNSAKTVDEIVERARKALQDPEDQHVYQDLGLLHGMLLRSLEPQLAGIKRLYISPDGPLNLIPFGALRDGSLRYLTEKYTVTYLASGRDLLRTFSRRADVGAPLVVASPDYDAATRPALNIDRALLPVFARIHFSPLEGTLEEARAITPLLPDPVLKTGRDATETLLRGVAGPKILHIATHGFFLDASGRVSRGKRRGLVLDDLPSDRQDPGDPRPRAAGSRLPPIDNPLFLSGLALAGANGRHGQADDGILTAYEASALDLRGTELVVLSACETGVGAVDAGEGVHGLRRALVVAGAETQVMSLWQVDDKGTRDLMTSYYEKLFSRGLGRGEALQEAQRAMLSQAEYKHPFFWASFISSGATGPIRGTERKPDGPGVASILPGGARGCGCASVGERPFEGSASAGIGAGIALGLFARRGARRRATAREEARRAARRRGGQRGVAEGLAA